MARSKRFRNRKFTKILHPFLLLNTKNHRETVENAGAPRRIYQSYAEHKVYKFTEVVADVDDERRRRLLGQLTSRLAGKRDSFLLFQSMEKILCSVLLNRRLNN